MTCTSCGAANDAGRTFCLECGAALAEDRQLFERMGAGLWLARLDAALATEPAGASRPASSTPVGDAIPR